MEKLPKVLLNIIIDYIDGDIINDMIRYEINQEIKGDSCWICQNKDIFYIVHKILRTRNNYHSHIGYFSEKQMTKYINKLRKEENIDKEREKCLCIIN